MWCLIRSTSGAFGRTRGFDYRGCGFIWGHGFCPNFYLPQRHEDTKFTKGMVFVSLVSWCLRGKTRVHSRSTQKKTKPLSLNPPQQPSDASKGFHQLPTGHVARLVGQLTAQDDQRETEARASRQHGAKEERAGVGINSA